MSRESRQADALLPTEAPHRDQSGACFGCGVDSPAGLHLEFRPEPGGAAGRVHAACRLGGAYAGPPGVIHGGVVATVLDEAMAKVVAHRGWIGVTQELRVQYRRPLLVDQEATVAAHLVRRRGGALHLHAALRDAAGKLLAEGRARFLLLSAASLGVLTRRR